MAIAGNVHAREKKDDSAARAKARESMEKRKQEKKRKETPKKQEEEDEEEEKPVKPITVYSENDPDLPSPSEPDHGIWNCPCTQN